ncbi:MAG TPA: LptF/LptG family permease [Balneolales bacterium]|nr:LptF/LptG family permease [Balneolales bacterium]
MTPIQRDVVKRHIGPFIFVFLTIMFLLLMQFLILYLDKIVGKGIPWNIILELIFSNLAYMVVLAVPMAVLIAALMAYGRFSELNELTALKAAGVNPLRMMVPTLFLSILMALALGWFSNYVLPNANYRARALFIDIRLKKPGFDLKPNVFYDGIKGYTFYVKHMSDGNDSLFDVTLFQDQTEKRDFAIIKAKTGYLKSEKDNQTLTLYLTDGYLLKYMSGEYSPDFNADRTAFKRYRISFDLSELAFSRSNPDRYSRDDRTMSAQAMMAVIDTLKAEMKRKRLAYNEQNSAVTPFLKTTVNEHTKPLIPLKNVNSNPKSQSARVAEVPAYKSRFVTLNHLPLAKEQQLTSELAVEKLRHKLLSYENMELNLQWREQRIEEYLVEVHKKISIPFGCIIFMLIGAPIGMLTRKGNIGYAALICAIIFTFYWTSLIEGEKLADRMIITPFTSMWAGNILLTIIGILLTIKIWRDHLLPRKSKK